MSWAQAHMKGYAILRETPSLSEFLETKLGCEIDEDPHVLEQIELLYNYNPPDDNDPELLRIEELLEEFVNTVLGDNEPLLSAQAMRHLIAELLVSKSADNSYWRFDLQSSLRALNEGEVSELATPLHVRRQGTPFTLNQWKNEVLRQVYVRLGGGVKKYRALEEVGAAIGQSPETLRAWEKSLRRSPDNENDLYCSELAGRFKDSLEGKPLREIEQMEGYGWHRGTHNLAREKQLYQTIKKLSLNEIRVKISHYRQNESGG